MARRISSPVLIGRDAELRAFDLGKDEAVERRPCLIVIGGEAGIGKSRLVSEFVTRTRAVGGIAAVGAALPPAGSERVPLAAITQMLRALVRTIDVRLLDHVLGPSRGDLAALLPELGPPSSATVSPPFAAARLAEAVLVAVEAVAMRHRLLLVVLEDLHWLDEATAATLVYVARNLVDAPVVLVMTYRSDHPREPGGVLDVIAEVSRGRNVERLELTPLEAADVEAQVRAIAGDDVPATRLHDIARRSGGNPFFVEELILEGSEDEGRRPPPSVRAATTARMSRLGGGARALIEALAIAGRPMPTDLLGEAAAVPRGVLVAAFVEATASHLVVPVPTFSGPGVEELDIRHILIREAIVGTLPGLRRRRLHRASPPHSAPAERRRRRRRRAHLDAGEALAPGRRGPAPPCRCCFARRPAPSRHVHSARPRRPIRSGIGYLGPYRGRRGHGCAAARAGPVVTMSWNARHMPPAWPVSPPMPSRSPAGVGHPACVLASDRPRSAGPG